MFDLQKVKNELKEFDNYKFYEEPHIYTYLEDDGSEAPIGISVTTLIGNYENPFDEDKIAALKSVREGVPKQDILDRWHFDKNFASVKGTHTHAYNEYLWQGMSYEYDRNSVIAEFGYDVISPVWDRLKQICDKFYHKYKDYLIPIGLEQIVGSKDYDIAGSIDFLAYSKKLDALVIIDYKTNKEIKRTSYHDKKMLSPLNDIPDSNYYHYCLQLAVYKCLIEHETNLKICPKKWLIWINEKNDNCVLYECENLDDKAQEILEARRVRK